MAKSKSNRRFTVADIAHETGAGDTTIRRYLRRYEASHPTVSMRASDNSWSVNSTTFNAVVRQISSMRAELNLV